MLPSKEFTGNTELSCQSELVLKIYRGKDLRSYTKELNVLESLERYRRDLVTNSPESSKLSRTNQLIGYPEIVSKKEYDQQAELLMLALGSNLKKLSKECPGGAFSKTTVYMITI